MNNSTAYMHIGRVYFHKDNIGAGFEYIKEFEDNCDSVIIISDIEIDFVYRGWVGDITYWATGGFNVKDCNCIGDLTSEARHVKDALLARIEVKSDRGCAVEWKYTFLKY